VPEEGFEPYWLRLQAGVDLVSQEKRWDTAVGTQRDFLLSKVFLKTKKWKKSWEDCSKLVNWDYQKGDCPHLKKAKDYGKEEKDWFKKKAAASTTDDYSFECLKRNLRKSIPSLKIPWIPHLYSGEEAVAVGVIQALDEEDNILCYLSGAMVMTLRQEAWDSKTSNHGGGCMGSREGCSKGRWRIYASFWLHQRIFSEEMQFVCGAFCLWAVGNWLWQPNKEK